MKKVFYPSFLYLLMVFLIPSTLLAQEIIDDITSERIVDLNINQLKQTLLAAPEEFSSLAETQTTLLTLPLPDGTAEIFSVQESSVFAPKLAAKYPDIKSYLLINPKDGSHAGRLSMTPNGADYLIFSEKGMAFLENFKENGTIQHKAYYSSLNPSEFACGTIAEERFTIPTTANARFNTISNGANLKIYDIAIAASGEFTQGNGGTLTGANSAINTRLSALNAIFEKELAMRFILIASNDNIVFFDAGTDGLNPNNRTSTAQTVINAGIGAANYDIGHVLYQIPGGGISTSGIAGLGVVCNNSRKGEGWTGATGATSVSFLMGTFAHEIGHQFGADHSYYGTAGNCIQRSPGHGYEPGGGNSIMSYETTCNTHNITPQVNSNYFHIHSIVQMLNHVNSTTCATTMATGNTPPVVTVPANVTIPRGTPFTLTGNGTDADNDALTYVWEQYDTDNLSLSFPAGAPNDAATSTTAPLFRSFAPSASGNSRTFPKISDILNNTQTQGEILPQVTRTLHMRLTARDNKENGGGLHCKEMTVTIDGDSDPFAITSPTGGTYIGNGSNTTDIKWTVGNTATAPISCATVNILFSTDGGLTFPITLAANTPNDGIESIVIPSNITSMGRIKIECPSNIFFDITRENITISDVCPSPAELTLTLESSSSTYTADQGAAALNLPLSYSAIGQSLSTISGDIDGTEPTLGNFPISNGDNNTSCTNFNGGQAYEIVEFEVSQNGTYTFTAQSGTLNDMGTLYEGAFNPASTCTNWLGATRWVSGVNIQNSKITISKNLTTGTKYYFVSTYAYFGPTTGTYSFSVSGPGAAFTDAPSGYTYTYAVVKDGSIVEFDNNADLTDRTAGDYTVYVVAHPSGYNINNLVGSTYAAFITALGSTVCGAVSTNAVAVTINSTGTPGFGEAGCGGTDNFTVTDADIPGTTGVFQTNGTIETSGMVTISSGDGNIEFKSGTSITLKDGFHAVAGSSFLATIANCSGSFQEDSEEVFVFTQSKTLNNTELKIMPNPLSDQTSFVFTLAEDLPVTINVYDRSGQLIERVAQHQLMYKGINQVTFDAQRLQRGMFFVLLQAGQQIQTKKMIVLE